MNINHRSLLRLSGFVVIFVLATALSSCKTESATDNPVVTINPNDPVPINTLIPKTPGSIIIPDNNKMTDAKIELGRHLFYDKSLSVDNSTSCGTCHTVTQGFSDIFPTSMGFQRQHGNRNAPALANVAYNTSFTWNGRFKSLEEHAPGPIFNSVEMGNNFSKDGNNDTVSNGYNSKPGGNDTLFLFKRLNEKPLAPGSGKKYPELFLAAWGDANISLDRIAKSIATFERTFISTGSKFDQYNSGDKDVFKYNPEAIHGFQLFTDANGANCVSCHSGYNFTDQKFHDNGIGINKNDDEGRMDITKDPSDKGKFKTPSLRNINLSGPYMHDGSFESLTKVLAHYNSGGTHSANQDEKIKPLNLSDQDIADIISFLQTLTDNSFVSDKSGKFANPWQN